MTLAVDIEQCKAQALAALDLSHDFYAHSTLAWRSLQFDVKRGRKLAFRNLSTGSVIDQDNLLTKSQQYVTHYLASSTFQHFTGLFEDFLFDLMARWLLAYPASLNSRTVKLEIILRSPDNESVLRSVVDAELNDLKYKRMVEWFRFMDGLVVLKCPSPEEIERLSEVKASRDILVHNRGIVNAPYVSKSGGAARYKPGDRLEISEPYHRSSWELIRKIIIDIAEAAKIKAG